MSEPVRLTGSASVAVQAGDVALVKGSESLQDIAAAHKVSIESILAANPNLKSADQIRPGMELRLPETHSISGMRAMVSDLPGPMPRVSDGFERLTAAVSDRFGSVADLPFPNPSPTSGTGGTGSPRPIDPVPERHKLEAVPLYHLQQSLRGGLGGVAATPINIPNEMDGAIRPRPIPSDDIEGGPQPDPDPIPEERFFQQARFAGVRDGIEPGPEPEPGPDPVPERSAIVGIGLKADQDVPPGGAPDPDPGPDPIPDPDGRSLLSERLIGASAQLKIGHDPDPGPDALSGSKVANH